MAVQPYLLIFLLWKFARFHIVNKKMMAYLYQNISMGTVYKAKPQPKTNQSGSLNFPYECMHVYLCI